MCNIIETSPIVLFTSLAACALLLRLFYIRGKCAPGNSGAATTACACLQPDSSDICGCDVCILMFIGGCGAISAVYRDNDSCGI